MKKIMIGAGICIAIGGVLLTAGLSGSLKNDRAERNTQTITEAFTSISAETWAGDVRVLPSTNGECRVEYMGTEKQYFSVKVENNVLTVAEVDARKWYECIGAFFNEIKATVYLPDAVYQMMTIKTDSGDIDVGQVRVENAKLTVSSGEIRCNGGEMSKSLEAVSSSGEVELSNVTCGAVTMRTSSGDIELGDMAAQSLSIVGVSAEVSLERVKTEGETRIQTSSGEVELSNVTCGAVTIQTSSGEVELSACDGAYFNVETKSGSVKGSVRTPKIFSAQSSIGNVRVPQTNEGGRFDVKTVSGNIYLRISG